MNELPRLIQWAFLCADVEARNDGGWNITNLNDHFDLADLQRLLIVFQIGQSPFSEFRLGIIIGTKLQAEIETQSRDITVETRILAIPIGETLTEPGNYTISLFADGAPQHTLDLFLR